MGCLRTGLAGERLARTGGLKRVSKGYVSGAARGGILKETAKGIRRTKDREGTEWS